ncbi:uncharacterized protein BX663DRAFT_503930 [Cokeromyces recurvatus]|uniref:uncharacterized protein n=1 Tax=Cokeromyces recurvatus TaxID=90255 RepID=UPI00221E7CBE|nr:uncharacterized protein BX663DRAFT_503930 [Cokeromyces recurvatus]KAI7904889.1 hypothetical protein BX663DRAFT_503930 [Cokeromyces recurvatus]
MTVKVISKAQVRRNNTKNSCWVIINNKVYDVTTFLADHPGGDEIILQFAGMDITSVLNKANYHIHSDAAYDLLTEYYLGDLAKEEKDEDEIVELRIKQNIVEKRTNNRDEEFLDLRKPLFPQLWNATYSKAYYLEQVHKPRYTPYCVPYFEHPLLDKLSKTHWYIVPMIWLPFVGFQLWRSLNTSNGSIEITLTGFIAGVLFWTLFEYILHRFLFHLDSFLPDHPIALLIHFTLHGIHHHMPMDRLRLVMPPALTIILSIPVFKLAHTLFYPALAFAFIAGAFFGYVCYDMIHYYLHHAKVFKIYFKELKRYHVAHHYKDFNSGFGITSKFWDYVFGTVLTYENKK